MYEEARVPQRPQGQKDERLVSSMLGRVAGLVVHGYRLTDDQAKTIRDLLGAGSWMGTAELMSRGSDRSPWCEGGHRGA